MYIFIHDNDYKKRIKRFMQLNYSANKSLHIIDDLNLIDSRQSTLLLTDDLSVNRPDLNVQYVVDGVVQGDNQHSKFQNFKQLIEQIGGNLTNENLKRKTRITLVTSLVGGVGKSTVAQNITKIIGRSGQSLLVNLFAPKTSGKNTFSEYVVTHRHNRSFDLTKHVTVENGLNRLDGFFAAEELTDTVIASVFDSIKNLFSASPYQEIIIDAPAIPYCKAMAERVDHVYLIRSEKRFAEEEQIAANMQLQMADWSQIINGVSGKPSARCLPLLDNEAAYDVALSEILIEDGLYEY